MERRRAASLSFALLALSGCAGSDVATIHTAPPRATTTPRVTPTTTAATASPELVLPRPTATTARRVVAEQAWVPFARVDDITVRLPSSRVEFVGFHQSNHEGARDLTVLEGAPRPRTLEGRGRLTGAKTAADVVIDPDKQVRAPVTGRVKRAGTYVLYCEHSDDYAVIAPDAHPAWEVKILHIDGVSVRAGDRVVAGESVIAQRPTKLPFESDTDEFSAKPAWPHVHIEVVDPTIPNRPSPGSGC